MDKKINAGIIGCLGYGGIGTLEILLQHPQVTVTILANKSETGKKIHQIFPHLTGHCELTIQTTDIASWHEKVDIVFCCTPDGVGQALAPAFTAKDIKFIDFSGDFRFPDIALYQRYADRIGHREPHQQQGLLKQSIYGLSELNRAAIRTSKLVGNPGCFAVSCILGLAPAVKQQLIHLDGIICDCKTGISGAGKKPHPRYHYPEVYDNMRAYKLNKHQHVIEIEAQLSHLSGGTAVTITFTPQVMPVNRGIISTLYGKLKPGITAAQVIAAYTDFYQAEPFVRIFEGEANLSTADVRGTNYCNLSVNVDQTTGSLLIVAHIDNLIKGQAGSAVQNMNLMFGLAETTGHDRIMPHP